MMTQWQAKCQDCQWYKLPGRGHGHIATWEEVTINLIALGKSMPTKDKLSSMHWLALYCIKPSRTHQNWQQDFSICSWQVHTVLALLLPPVHCIDDKEGEFVFSAFEWILELFTVKDVCLTSKNPQAKAICEQMHKTVSNVLWTLVHANPQQNMAWLWQCMPCKHL